MEAQFNSVSLKVFNQALASISRFGEKLFILPTHDDHGCPEVRLSVLNSSRTGFCSVYFREDFFESLTCAVGQDVIEASINIKALQSIVKNTRSSNKNVEACELSFIEEGIEDLLSIRLHCQHGVTKTHKLPYEPKIQSLPNGPPEDSPNHLIMSPNCARNWTDHFLGPKSGEISLWVTDQTCVVRSSEDIPPLNPTKASKDSTGNRMQITTEVVVSISDFEEYNIGQETRLTFNLKEFKSMTLLSEQLNCSLELIFTVGNEPIHIFLRKEKVVLVNTTLATHANDSPIVAANGIKSESKNAVGGAGGAIVASGNSVVNGLKVNGSGTSSRDRQSSAASSSAARQTSNEVEDRDGERSASPQRSRPKARPIGKTMAQDDFASGSNSASNSQPTPSASASKGGKGPRSAPLPMESTPKDGASKQRSVTPRGSSREGPLFFPSASQQSNQDQDLDLDLEMGDDGVDFGADDDDFNAVEAEIASGVLEVRGSQSQAFRNKLNSSQHQKKVVNEVESQPTQSEAGEGSLEIKTNSDRKGRPLEPISSTPRIPKPKSSSSDQVQSKPNSPVRQKDSSNRRAGSSVGVQISQPGSIPSQSQEAFDYDERDHRRAREKERKRVEREERKKQKEAELQERQSEEENEEVAQRQNEGVAQDPIQAESSSPRSRKSSSVAPAARNGRPMTSTASSKIPSSLIMDTIHPTPVSQGGDSLEVAAYQEGIETDGEGFEDELGETERSQEDSEAIRQVYAADQGQTNPTNLNVNQFTPRNIESYERELASSSLARQERLSGEMQEVRRLERINNNQGAEIGGGLEESNLGGIDEEVERGLEDDDEADELPPSQPRTSSLVDSDNENPNKKKKRRVQSFKPKF